MHTTFKKSKFGRNRMSKFGTREFDHKILGRLRRFDSLTYFQDFKGYDIRGYGRGSIIETFTASRSASNPATYIDDDGIVNLIETSDVLRRTGGYYDSSELNSGPGLLLEGASTNLHINTFGSAFTGDRWDDWTLGEGVSDPVTESIGDTSGVTNIPGATSQRVQYTGVVADSGALLRHFSISSAVGSVVQNDTITLSFWARSLTGNTGVNIQPIILRRDAADASIGSTPGSNITLTSSWQRFSETFTLTDATLSRIRVGVGSSDGSVDDGDSLDYEFTMMQSEVAAYPSSFIPTTIAALTRNTEVLTYPVDSNFVGGADGSVVYIFRPITLPDEQAGGAFKKWFSVVIDANNEWYIRYSSNANDLIQFVGESGGTAEGGGSTAEPFGSSRYSLHSVIGTYSTIADASGNKMNQYINGSVDGTDVNYVVPVGSLPSFISIKNDIVVGGIIVAIAIFNKRLSAEEASRVHNLLI